MGGGEGGGGVEAEILGPLYGISSKTRSEVCLLGVGQGGYDWVGWVREAVVHAGPVLGLDQVAHGAVEGGLYGFSNARGTPLRQLELVNSLVNTKRNHLGFRKPLPFVREQRIGESVSISTTVILKL